MWVSQLFGLAKHCFSSPVSFTNSEPFCSLPDLALSEPTFCHAPRVLATSDLLAVHLYNHIAANHSQRHLLLKGENEKQQHTNKQTRKSWFQNSQSCKITWFLQQAKLQTSFHRENSWNTSELNLFWMRMMETPSRKHSWPAPSEGSTCSTIWTADGSDYSPFCSLFSEFVSQLVKQVGVTSLIFHYSMFLVIIMNMINVVSHWNDFECFHKCDLKVLFCAIKYLYGILCDGSSNSTINLEYVLTF